MGAPIGNRNAAGPHKGGGKRKSKFGKVGSKSWKKKVNADYRKRGRITGTKKLPGYRRGRYSYRKYS